MSRNATTNTETDANVNLFKREPMLKPMSKPKPKPKLIIVNDDPPTPPIISSMDDYKKHNKEYWDKKIKDNCSKVARLKQQEIQSKETLFQSSMGDKYMVNDKNEIFNFLKRKIGTNACVSETLITYTDPFQEQRRIYL